MDADVRSIDAVREWHATLANYADSLSEALAGVELEIRRAFDWLDEQRGLWQQAVRDCEEEVVRAKAELAQRKFKTWDDREPDCTVQERALRRARARLEHAEEKVETVRHWIGKLPKVIDEVYRGSGRRLLHFLEDDVPKAQSDLARRIASLEVYAELRPDFASGASSPSPPGGGVGEGARQSPNPPAPFPGGEGGVRQAEGSS
jgi:hypothetical protein